EISEEDYLDRFFVEQLKFPKTFGNDSLIGMRKITDKMCPKLTDSQLAALIVAMLHNDYDTKSPLHMDAVAEHFNLKPKKIRAEILATEKSKAALSTKTATENKSQTSAKGKTKKK
ncbi:MAG TPA: hypothetical protein VFB79_00420, partial [Candidatus Angelobacter sp.]|nr:hypothetical protein [Candidatus Angelobacter sp.]